MTSLAKKTEQDNNNNKETATNTIKSASNEEMNADAYKKQGFNTIPSRGVLSALTVPGAVSGWKLAYDYSVKHLGGRLTLSRLLFDAEQTSKDGIAVTNTLKNNIKSNPSKSSLPNCKKVIVKWKTCILRKTISN